MITTFKSIVSAALSVAVLAIGVAGVSQPAAAKKLSGGEIAAIAIVGAAAVVALSSKPKRCVEKTRCVIDDFGDEVCRTRTVCR